jgi:hypothetical protein
MLMKSKWLPALRGTAIAAMLCGPALALNGSLSTTDEARPIIADTFSYLDRTPSEDFNGVGKAAIAFVRALAAADAEALWMFASEEEHDAFGTEQAVYAAYADAFPSLTRAEEVVAERAWQEGDTPFVEARVKDADAQVYRATMGFWLSDAGDWQLISCDVRLLSDNIAGL